MNQHCTANTEFSSASRAKLISITATTAAGADSSARQKHRWKNESNILDLLQGDWIKIWFVKKTDEGTAFT